jgi:hypothetical protein
MSATGITVVADKITINSFSAATTGGANGSFSFTVALSKGTATATTASRTGTITATATPANPDAAAVATAKSLIENGTYSVAQATANEANTQFKTSLATQINALPGMNATGIRVTADKIGIITLIPAVTGSSNGSFTFQVILSKGSSSNITVAIPGVITATPNNSSGGSNPQQPDPLPTPQPETVGVPELTLPPSFAISSNQVYSFAFSRPITKALVTVTGPLLSGEVFAANLSENRLSGSQLNGEVFALTLSEDKLSGMAIIPFPTVGTYQLVFTIESGGEVYNLTRSVSVVVDSDGGNNGGYNPPSNADEGKTPPGGSNSGTGAQGGGGCTTGATAMPLMAVALLALKTTTNFTGRKKR